MLTLGNGRMLVNFDADLNMRDFFYPRVGMNNHILGHRNRIGVWSDGWFSWVDSNEWVRSSGYEEGSLIGLSTATNAEKSLSLLIEDGVDFRKNVFVKSLRVVNGAPFDREVRIFFTHDFNIDESDIGDTSLYDPESDAIVHYKRDKWFLMTGRTHDNGIFQYANGLTRFHGAEGTWRDAEDGTLEGNPIAQGSVDSCISFRLFVGAEETQDLTYWIACGNSLEEVRDLHFRTEAVGVRTVIDRTKTYWRSWLNKGPTPVSDLSPEAMSLYLRSLLLVRTHIDRGGAITAANDSDILHFNRDDYSYVWPRDGAFVAASMCAAGYPELTRPFFRFCARGLSPDGYMWHKYHPDGSIGSSWHPWFKDGSPLLPIQEDETALVLYALWALYEADNDIDFIQTLYATFIRKAADFMVSYTDPDTGLPLESYDLWEERRGVYTYTAATVWAGLVAASKFAALLGDQPNAVQYEKTAAQIKTAVIEHLFDERLGRFVRGIYFTSDAGDGVKRPEQDTTVESSVGAVHRLGMLSADDPMVVSTMHQIEANLHVKTAVGGFARYENDWYFKATDDANVPGNPWIICSLWIADWHIARAMHRMQSAAASNGFSAAPTDGFTPESGLKRAKEIIEWTVSKAAPTGVLPEQLHPFSGDPLSVAPLTWSHSTYVYTVLRYSGAWKNQTRGPVEKGNVSTITTIT